MKVLNFELLRHPMNWVVVMLMVIIAGVAFHFFLQWQIQPSTGTPKQQ